MKILTYAAATLALAFAPSATTTYEWNLADELNRVAAMHPESLFYVYDMDRQHELDFGPETETKYVYGSHINSYRDVYQESVVGIPGDFGGIEDYEIGLLGVPSVLHPNAEPYSIFASTVTNGYDAATGYYIPPGPNPHMSVGLVNFVMMADTWLDSSLTYTDSMMAHGGTDVQVIVTEWICERGMKHKVVTPVEAKTKSAQRRAMVAHLNMLETMQEYFPPMTPQPGVLEAPKGSGGSDGPTTSGSGSDGSEEPQGGSSGSGSSTSEGVGVNTGDGGIVVLPNQHA